MQGTPLTHQILKQFDPLVHSVVRRRGFTPHHAYYHDFCQELRIHLLTLFDQFDGRPLGDDRFAFVAYAKRGLSWHLAKYLRGLHPERELSLTEIEETAGHIPLTTGEADYSITQLFADLEAKLDADLYELLQLMTYGDYSVKELADYFGVNRRTISNRKKRLRVLIESWILTQP